MTQKTYEVRVYDGGTIIKWFLNNQLHRENGPAVEKHGSKYWYINNKLHREDGPAIEASDGFVWWYLKDHHYFTKRKWYVAVKMMQSWRKMRRWWHINWPGVLFFGAIVLGLLYMGVCSSLFPTNNFYIEASSRGYCVYQTYDLSYDKQIGPYSDLTAAEKRLKEVQRWYDEHNK